MSVFPSGRSELSPFHQESFTVGKYLQILLTTTILRVRKGGMSGIQLSLVVKQWNTLRLCK